MDYEIIKMTGQAHLLHKPSNCSPVKKHINVIVRKWFVSRSVSMRSFNFSKKVKFEPSLRGVKMAKNYSLKTYKTKMITLRLKTKRGGSVMQFRRVST